MKLMELYKDKVMGAIIGLDRMRFRGSLRWLANEMGIKKFISGHRILLKDFTDWAKQITSGLRHSCDEKATQEGIPTIYLNRSGIDKERLARDIAEQKGVREGPICNLSVLETCYAPKGACPVRS